MHVCVYVHSCVCVYMHVRAHPGTSRETLALASTRWVVCLVLSPRVVLFSGLRLGTEGGRRKGVGRGEGGRKREREDDV